MKKIFTLITMAFLAMNTYAADDVYYPVTEYQTTDYGWWLNFTDNYTIEAGKSAEFIFYNYSDKANNWDNWDLVACTTGWTERGGDGYTEYFVLRADNYGWGTYYDSTGLSNTYDWTDFPSLMDGALVDMTVSLGTDGTFTMTSTTTDTDGNTYDYGYTCSITTAPEEICIFFTAENSYLSTEQVEDTDDDEEEDDETVEVEDTPVDTSNADVYYPVTEYQTTDYGWWLNFTDNYTLEAGKAAEFIFYNYSDKANNWDNWDLVVCTTGWTERGGDGYTEYLVLRADNYGWGTYYASTGLSNTYDWTDFPSLMDGALVDMTVSLTTAGTFTMTSTTTDTDGNTYDYGYTCSITTAPEEICIFFTAENSYLADASSVASAISVVETEAETATSAVYNLAGQSVGKSYKGIVIENGKKVIRK